MDKGVRLKELDISGITYLRGSVLDNRSFTTFNTRKRRSRRFKWAKKIMSKKKIFF